MTDTELKRSIERAAAAGPDAPWLEDRVMAAIAADGSRPTERNRPLRWAPSIPALAAVVIAALMVGMLIGSRIASRPATPAGAPSRDSAAVNYASMVSRDMGVVDHDYIHHYNCQTRAACADQLLQMRADTEEMLVDLSATPTAKGESASAERLRAAALQFVDEVDAAIAAVEQPDSDYVVASSAPSIDRLELAAAGVECWPLAAVAGNHGVECSET